MHQGSQAPEDLGVSQERMAVTARMGQMELKDSLDPAELKALQDLKAALASDHREPLARQVQQANQAKRALEALEADEAETGRQAHQDRPVPSAPPVSPTRR